MEGFLVWLSASPLATALKVAVAAVLGWTLVNLDGLNVPPVVAVALVAAIPVLINWINPADSRYGRGSDG